MSATTPAPVPITTPIERAWTKLAPKVIAFLASGLTTSAVIGVLQLFGVTIKPELATMLVGGISTVAAFIIRDNLLALAPSQLSLKVVVFILSSTTAAGLVALLSQFGVDLSGWSWLIGVGLTAVGGLLGYSKTDYALAA